MPLKIRVKPEGKVFAGGAVLKNVGKKPAELLILSDSPVLRDDYMMNIEKRNDSDVSNIYFLLQVVYLFKGKGQPLDALVVNTLNNFSELYPALSGEVANIIDHLKAGEMFKALRLAHKLLADEQQPQVAFQDVEDKIEIESLEPAQA
jgi:flagellar biosynthesis regulator FlbT